MRNWYITIHAPRLLKALETFSPITIYNHTTMIGIPIVIHRDAPLDDGDRAHEEVHVAQMWECALVASAVVLPLLPYLGWPAAVALVLCWMPYGIGFWPIYVGHYLVNLARGMEGPAAYKAICFEGEAYANPHDRSAFGWLKHFS